MSDKTRFVKEDDEAGFEQFFFYKFHIRPSSDALFLSIKDNKNESVKKEKYINMEIKVLNIAGLLFIDKKLKPIYLGTIFIVNRRFTNVAFYMSSIVDTL